MKLNVVQEVSGIQVKNDFMTRNILALLLLVLFNLPLQAAGDASSSDKGNVSVRLGRNLSDEEQRIFDYYFIEAVNLKQQAKFPESFGLLKYCTLVDSLNPQPWFEISVFYRNLKRNDLAIDALEKAHRLDKGNEWYTFALANMYISLDSTKDAVGLYEEIAKNKPDDEDILYQLADLYSRTGNTKAAIKTLNQVERMIGKNEDVSFAKYKIYKQTGDNNKAINEIEELAGVFPYDIDYILLLGDAWMDLGYPEKAYKSYVEAREKDPTNPQVPLSLADYYNAVGDSVSANAQLSIALTNPGTDVDTKLSILAPILNSSIKGNADTVQISKYFDILLEQHPNEYKIHELHVRWLMARNHKQEAKDELRTVLDLNPNQLVTWKNYLELNLESNNQSNIRDICNEALIYFPKESLFWFYLGVSWMTENESSKVDKVKCNKAIDAFDKAIEVANQDDKSYVSRIYGIMGDTWLQLKDSVKAFDYYEKALKEFPGNVLVLNNYAYYLAESGADLAKAERMSRETIEADPKNPTFLDTFAWIYFKLGKYSLAKIYIERAVNEPDPGSVVLEHYGDILWFNSEEDKAREQWKKAAALENPSDTLIKKVEAGKYISF